MGAIHNEGFTDKLYESVPKGWQLRDFPVYSDDKTEREYRLRRKGFYGINFRARALPGCCGVLVVYYLRPANNKPFTFRATLRWIVKCAGQTKFGAVMLTQTDGSLGLKALSYKQEYTPSAVFKNFKTGNGVAVYVIDTEYKAPKKKLKFEDE